MLGNIAEQNTDNSAIVKINNGERVIAHFDPHLLRTIAPGDPVCVDPTENQQSPFYWITARASCQYFSREWNPPSDELCQTWGPAKYLFEVHSDGNVSRQIQLYENGLFILYDEICPEDQYGSRSSAKLDFQEFEPFQFSRDEFFNAWDPEASVNRCNQ
ncbi:MAG: hypothetical protein KDA78_12985 [Planctomycetaceae bacterium]|nr:hypothetical protein [Planctomycetaceae bacterium]